MRAKRSRFKKKIYIVAPLHLLGTHPPPFSVYLWHLPINMLLVLERRQNTCSRVRVRHLTCHNCTGTLESLFQTRRSLHSFRIQDKKVISASQEDIRLHCGLCDDIQSDRHDVKTIKCNYCTESSTAVTECLI